MTGKLIGKYQIISELTPGSLGPVYLGRLPGQATEMVIRKVPLNRCSSSERVLLMARIRRAAWIQRQLRHPGIVRLQEAFSDGQACYLVSEHIAGTDLRQLLQREGLPAPAQALSICRQLLVALDYAHNLRYLDESDTPQVGVLHRDLHPSVIILDLSGRLRITAFGVANLPDNPAYPYTGLQPGTLEYLAPELRRGAEPDLRTDIYSLGVILYELMTGSHPYLRYRNAVGVDGRAGREMRLNLEEDPVPISEIRSDIDPRISRVLMLALDRRPAIRHQSAAAFLQALSDYEPGVEETESVDKKGRPDHSVRRRPSHRPRTPVVATPTLSPPSTLTEPKGETVDRILATKKFSLRRFLGASLLVLLCALIMRVWLADGYRVRTDSGSDWIPAPSVQVPRGEATPVVVRVTPEVNPAETPGLMVPPDQGAVSPADNESQLGAIALLTRAREADQNGRFSEALRLYEDYLQIGSMASEARDVTIYVEKLKSFIGNLESAKQAFERGDYRQARAAYAEALRLRPYSGFAKAGLEDAEARLAQPGRSVEEPPADPPPFDYERQSESDPHLVSRRAVVGGDDCGAGRERVFDGKVLSNG